MPDERVIINGEGHVIEVKPITLVTHDSTVADVGFPQRLMLEPSMTVFHGERVKELHPRTMALVKTVFPTPVQSLGYTHFLGLIDLSFKFMDQGIPIGWRYPETYLHPAQQAALTDCLMEILNYISPLPEVSDDSPL
jgi:hypothetical protein